MISKHTHGIAAGNWFALAMLLGLGTVAPIAAVAQEAKRPQAAKPADPNRYLKKITLPGGHGIVVVSEGDFEPRSLGSYTVRWYRAENADFPFDDFLDGCIRAREDGGIEKLLLREIDGDGAKDVVVLIRSVGNANFLSAEAFGFQDKQVTLIASVNDLEWNADVAKALRLKLLEGSEPGSEAWNGAVEAIVQIRDGNGHGPDLGSDEWLNAVNRKVLGEAADKTVKIGSPEWLNAIGKALPTYQAKAPVNVQQGILSLDGYGVVRFGDTLPDMLKKLTPLKATANELDGTLIDPDRWLMKKAQKAEAEEAVATFLTISCYPGVTFLVDDEKIVRADISTPGIPNQLKIDVGMTVKQVQDLCPAAKFKTAKYADKDQDLKDTLIMAPNGQSGWRIIEQEGEIIEIKAGLKTAIERVENG
jgi:hypothetical protein